MYYILRVRFQNFDWFEEAFAYQQEHHPEKKIIYSNNGIIEIVWNPDWEYYSIEGDDIVSKKYNKRE